MLTDARPACGDRSAKVRAKLKASDDQAALQAVGASLGGASDLLQVELQVDAARVMADMREDVMELMQEQGDARAEREALNRKINEVLHRQKAQWGSANEPRCCSAATWTRSRGEMLAAMAQMRRGAGDPAPRRPTWACAPRWR